MFLKLHVLRLDKEALLDIELVHHVDAEGPDYAHDGACSGTRPGKIIWVSKWHWQELDRIHRDVEDGGDFQKVT